MNTRQLKRKQHIEQVIATLKKAKDADAKVDNEKFIAAMQYDFNISRKTALDYIAVAKSQL